MAAPVYLTDLILLNTADDPATPVAWVEPTGSQAGGTGINENDYFIQGVACVSKTFNATGIGGLGFDFGATVTVPTNGAVYTWVYFAAPNAISNQALGGLQVLIGNSAAAYYRYYIAGSDTYTYGGWICVPVDPNFATPSGLTQGTPNNTWRFFGMAANVQNAIRRGNPCACDVVRYGRGSIDIWEGDSVNGFATFDGASAYNDNNDNRFGILQFQDGGYKFQGRLGMGTATTATQFLESNANITIQNTEFVTPGFNLFEVRNSASIVTWNNINVLSLSLAAPGDFTVTDNAAVTLNGCNFTDMGYFTLQSNTTATDVTFRRCKGVTPNNAIVNQCSFLNFNTSTSAITLSTPSHVNNITECVFLSTGSGHAVNLGSVTSSQSVNWNANILENYTVGSAGTFVGITGSASSALLTNVSTNNTLTISVINGATVPSIQNTGAGTVIVESNVTIFISVTDINNTPISAAQVAIYTISGDIEIFNGQTDVNGEVSASYSANIPIYIRVRKSTTGSTRYRSLETTGNTGATGATLFLTLVEDTFTELII